MKHSDNVHNTNTLKKDIEKAISKDLRIDDLQYDFTKGAKCRISEIREFFKVSKTDVAKMLGTTYRQYVRFEDGDSVLPSWVLSSIAFYFNLSLDFVSGASDEARALYEGEYKNVNGHILYVDSPLFNDLPQNNGIS